MLITDTEARAAWHHPAGWARMSVPTPSAVAAQELTESTLLPEGSCLQVHRREDLPIPAASSCRFQAARFLVPWLQHPSGSWKKSRTAPPLPRNTQHALWGVQSKGGPPRGDPSSASGKHSHLREIEIPSGHSLLNGLRPTPGQGRAAGPSPRPPGTLCHQDRKPLSPSTFR